MENTQVPSANRLALAKKLYQDGYSLAVTGTRVGMSKTTLAELFRKQGVPIRKASETRTFDCPTDEVRRLYEQGVLPSEIAVRVGRTKGAVLSRLNRNQIPAIRGRGGVRGRFKKPDVSTEDLVAAFLDGLNYTEIAKRFGTTRPTVVYRLKLAGCELPRKAHKVELPWGEVIASYLNGESTERIAERFGVGANTIRRALEKRGVTLRSRTQHLKSTWAERNRKLQEYEARQAHAARPRHRPQDSATGGRIILAAWLKLEKVTLYRMGCQLFPQHEHDHQRAYNSTKVLFNRKRAAIEQEQRRLKSLSEAQLREALTEARLSIAG